MDIKAKFLFEKNLWAEVAIQVINCQPLGLKVLKQQPENFFSILKHAGMVEHAKKGIKKQETLFQLFWKKFRYF